MIWQVEGGIYETPHQTVSQKLTILLLKMAIFHEVGILCYQIKKLTGNGRWPVMDQEWLPLLHLLWQKTLYKYVISSETKAVQHRNFNSMNYASS